MTIAIINGPNLNLLGSRAPEIYGSQSFEQTLEELMSTHPTHTFLFRQSNHEGDIIDFIQDLNREGKADGIILNPGAFAHYSYAIADALADSNIPVVEVHISNIHAREEFRTKSVTARHAKGIISGFGRESYNLAALFLIKNLANDK